MNARVLLDQIPDINSDAFRDKRFEAIRAFLERVYELSPLYKEKFAAVGKLPSDIRSWEEFRQLPVILNKADERRSQEWSTAELGHPMGMHLCVPPRDVIAVTGTSGTTGMPAFTYQFTRRDMLQSVELWRRACLWMGVEKGDLIFDLMGYSMGPIGTPALHAFWELGVRSYPVPAESGSQRILYLMDLFRPDFIICTPSFADYLAERSRDVIGKPVGDLRIKGILVAGEPGGGLSNFREKIRELYGARLYDAQIGSLGICNISCDADEYTGLHQLAPDLQVWPEDLVSAEDCVPIAVEHGAKGRMLLTSFDQEARPALKLDMGDLCQVWTEPCACGFRGLRYSIIGRTDDMLIVKGVNVYPAGIKNIVDEFNPKLTGHFRIILDGPPPRVKPPLQLKVEHSDGLSDEAVQEVREALRQKMHGVLKVTPEIEMVKYGSLPRSELKTRYIEIVKRPLSE